jgi:hypothetical protein
MGRAVATVLLLAVTITFTGAHARAAPPACAVAEVRAHDEAVFGHFSTRAAAVRLARHAGKNGFKGLKIEDEGCRDFELEIDGADRGADRASFAKEAASVGFEVTFEQRPDPLAYQSGQVFGLFARLSTLAAANKLAWRLAAANFRYIDVVPVGSRWWVVMPQVPVKNALSIASEVASIGLHIQFRPGVKQ